MAVVSRTPGRTVVSKQNKALAFVDLQVIFNKLGKLLLNVSNVLRDKPFINLFNDQIVPNFL